MSTIQESGLEGVHNSGVWITGVSAIQGSGLDWPGSTIQGSGLGGCPQFRGLD